MNIRLKKLDLVKTKKIPLYLCKVFWTNESITCTKEMEQIILSGLTVAQFKQMIADTFKEMYKLKDTFKKPASSFKEGKFINRKETAKLLHISLPTLHELTKEGKLISYRIGTRVLYKPDEVMETVSQRNFTNCERKGK